MRSRMLFVTMIVIAVVCFAHVPAYAQDAKAEVQATLDNWLKAYQDRDLDGIMSLMSSDEEVVMYGTGADEKRVGLDEVEMQVKRDWAQTDAISFEITWSHIGVHGDVAWVAFDGAFHATMGDQHMDLPARGTAVLVKENGAWKFVQFHDSVPAPGQEEGQSIPDKE